MFRPFSSRLIFSILAAFVTLALSAPSSQAQSAKAKKYPFATPPLEIYQLLTKADLGSIAPFPANDRSILIEIWEGQTATPPREFGQAYSNALLLHFLASGIPDDSRTGYLNKFNDLVAAAQDATVNATNNREKADQLLRFLHRTALSKGYLLHQTSLSNVFDSRKYNCVSASSLYYLVGTRMGLKLQPVLIKGSGFADGHAAIDLIDGDKRIEVETTNPEGYDYSTKLKNKPATTGYLPLPDRKKAYDTDGFGLAASAASNQGLWAMKANPARQTEAVRHMVVALCLAPTDPSIEINTIASINNWGIKLAEDKKFEEALKVYAFGRKALGERKEIEQNYRVVWQNYLDQVFGSGQIKEGAKLLTRAFQAFPTDKEFAQTSEWITRTARRIADKKDWAAGLAYADVALKDLSGDDAKAVRDWKEQARRWWSQSLLAKGDVSSSLKVLADGLAEAPQSKALAEGLGYHTLKALDHFDAKKSIKETLAHFKEVNEQFPTTKEVRNAAIDFVYRKTRNETKEKKFTDAVALADAYQALAGDQLESIKCEVFDSWARSLGEEGKREEGLAKYLEGLEIYPKNGRLSKNVIAYFDRWAAPAIDMKQWDEATRIFEIGLKNFPSDGHLKQCRDYYAKQKGK